MKAKRERRTTILEMVASGETFDSVAIQLGISRNIVAGIVRRAKESGRLKLVGPDCWMLMTEPTLAKGANR